MEKTLRMIGGLASAVKIGYEIKKRFPQIAEDYRDLMTRQAIADKYELWSTFNVENEGTMRSAVGFALRGNDLKKFEPKYRGLLSTEEANRLYASHREHAGENALLLKTGRYSPSAQKKAIASMCKSLGRLLWTEKELDNLHELIRSGTYYSTRGGETVMNLEGLRSSYNRQFRKRKKKVSTESIRHAIKRIKKTHGNFVKPSIQELGPVYDAATIRDNRREFAKAGW